MPYIITATANVVSLACKGEMTLAEMSVAWQEVRQAMDATGSERVLAEMTALRTSPDTEELFDLARLLWRDFSGGGRIALVVRWEQSRFAKLLEILVRNVGANLTVFVSEDQAKNWILRDLRPKRVQPLPAPVRRSSAQPTVIHEQEPDYVMHH